MNEFEINVAFAGQHWGKVVVPGLDQSDAVHKARVLCAALNAHMVSTGGQQSFDVSLTRWNRIWTNVELV